MKKEFFLVLLAAFVLSFFSIVPLFNANFFQMHDFTHVARLYELDKAIKDGQMPARWSSDFGYGYGMPLFNFYAPLPYYMAEFFHLVGFDFVVSIKIIFGLSFILSFLFMYLLAREFFGKIGALVSATAFVYAPYHAVDFYVRGTLGELWAIAFLPLLFWSFYRLSKNQNYLNFVLASISFAALVLSHNILALITIPFLLAFVVLLIFFNSNKRSLFISYLLSLIAGLGLSAFFFIPALLEKDFTIVNNLTTGYGNYFNHFLFLRQLWFSPWGYGASAWGLNDGMSFQIGQLHLILAFLSIVVAVWFWLKNRRISLFLFFFFLVMAINAFMTTFKSQFVWDKISLLAFVQFPWRFLSLVIFTVSFLSGAIFLLIKKTAWQAILAGVLILLFIFLNKDFFQPLRYVDPEEFYYTDKKLIQTNMSGILEDYLPVYVKEKPQNPPLQKVEIIFGEAEIQNLISKTQKITFDVNVNLPAKLRLNIFYFPGWQVLVDGKKVNIDYQNKLGIMEFEVGGGQHKVAASFEDTPVRTVGNVISLLSLIGLAGGGIWFRKRAWNKI